MSPLSRTILILSDEPALIGQIRAELEPHGVHTEVVAGYRQLSDLIVNGTGSSIIIDWHEADITKDNLLQLLVAEYPLIPVLIVLAAGEIEVAGQCLRLGVFDVIVKPVDLNRIASSIHKALQFHELLQQNRKLENYLLGEELSCPELFRNVTTKSPRMFGIFKIVETIGMTMNPVLITGEAGVGKRLIARSIHMAGQQEGAFVELNAADNEESNIDSLLNWIMCDTDGEPVGAGDAAPDLPQVGTVYLRSIDALSEVSQTLLLHLLRTREGCWSSQHRSIQRRIRIISASEKPIEEILAKGKLRRDLCHHLCAHHIHIPPLRERREDIPLLTERFIKDVAAVLNITPQKITQEAMTMLQNHTYQGNIRELKKKVSEAVTSNSIGHISVMDFNDI